MAHPPSDDEGFVSRWSRLKQRARDDKAGAAEPPQPALPVEAGPDAGKAPEGEPAEKDKKPFDISELPSVESLTKDSDYSAFMRAEVPEDLRQKALRRLWASDPILSAPEVLDMHNLDYNAVPTFPQGIRTLYRVGQGMLDSLEAEEAEKRAAAAKPEGEAPGVAETSQESQVSDAAPQQPDAVPSSGTPEKLAKS